MHLEKNDIQMTMKHRSNSRVFLDLSYPYAYENQQISRHCVNNKSLRLAYHSRFRLSFSTTSSRSHQVNRNQFMMEKKEYSVLGLDAKRSNKPLNFIIIIPAYFINPFKVSLLLPFFRQQFAEEGSTYALNLFHSQIII